MAVRFADLVAWPAATFAVTAACLWVGMAVALVPLRRWRRRRDAGGAFEAAAAAAAIDGAVAATPGWVTEARLLYPARLAARTGVMAAGILMATAAAAVPGGLLSAVPRVVVWLAMAAAGVAAMTAAASWLAGAVRGRRHPWRLAVRDTAVLWLVARPWPVLVTVTVIASAAASGAAQWAVVAGGGVVLCAMALASGLPVLRLLRLAWPAGERVRGAVERAAGRMTAAVPPSFEVAWSMANAFALPTTGRLVFSTRLLEVLDDAQLAAVAAHELEHLREPLRVRLSRLAGLPLLIGLGALVPVVEHAGVPGLVLLVGSLYLIGIIAGHTLLRMEVRADAAAHGAEADPGVYGAALTRLYEVNLTPAVLSNRRRSHPALYDRLVAAGTPPPYPRPAPPDRGWLLPAFVLQVVAGAAVCGLLFVGVPRAAIVALGAERGLEAIACLTGGDAYSLGGLDEMWVDRHEVRPAIAWARLQAAARPTDVERRSYLAKVLAWGGRCAEAGVALEQAELAAADEVDRGYVREAHGYMRRLRNACAPGTAGAAAEGPFAAGR